MADDNRCALCLGAADSDEHIIPESIGGGLKRRILCTSCNSAFGHTIDQEALQSGPIQEAALALKDQVPWFWRSIGHKARVEALSGGVKLQVEKGSGRAQVRAHKDDDTGIVWRPQSDVGRRQIRASVRARAEEARKRGLDFPDQQEFVERIMSLSADEQIRVPGATYVGAQGQGIVVHLGPALSQRYYAKIAFMTLAATGADLDDPALDPWRRYLRRETEEAGKGVDIFESPYLTDDYAAMHETSAEEVGNAIYEVNVGIFGRLGRRCVFTLEKPARIPFLAFGVNLAAGESRYCESREQYEAHDGVTIAAPDPERGW